MTPASPHVLRALRIIGERYDRADLHVRAVAGTLGISTEHLCRLLKRDTGLAFSAHVLRA